MTLKEFYIYDEKCRKELTSLMELRKALTIGKITLVVKSFLAVKATVTAEELIIKMSQKRHRRKNRMITCNNSVIVP